MKARVPLLITMDLEIALDHDLGQQNAILGQLCQDLAPLDLPMTVFTTAAAGRRFGRSLSTLHAHGHEIGCHGFAHGPDEDFRHLSESSAREVIGRATELLRVSLGNRARPTAFRGPRMSTSAVTQRVLVEEGYSSDYSVASQRLDILTSGGGVLRWLTAPRGAYTPDDTSPYRRGSIPLLVVPLSSIGVPFLSGSLYLFGLRFMKGLFRALLAEAKRFGRPIVFLFHSYEFTDLTKLSSERDRRPLHQRVYLRDRTQRYRDTLELFRYMLSFPEICPMTAAGFEQCWLGKASGRKTDSFSYPS